MSTNTDASPVTPRLRGDGHPHEALINGLEYAIKRIELGEVADGALLAAELVQAHLDPKRARMRLVVAPLDTQLADRDPHDDWPEHVRPSDLHALLGVIRRYRATDDSGEASAMRYDIIDAALRLEDADHQDPQPRDLDEPAGDVTTDPEPDDFTPAAFAIRAHDPRFAFVLHAFERELANEQRDSLFFTKLLEGACDFESLHVAEAWSDAALRALVHAVIATVPEVLVDELVSAVAAVVVDCATTREDMARDDAETAERRAELRARWTALGETLWQHDPAKLADAIKALATGGKS